MFLRTNDTARSCDAVRSLHCLMLHACEHIAALVLQGRAHMSDHLLCD